LGVREQYRLAIVGHRADIAGELNSRGFAMKRSKIVYANIFLIKYIQCSPKAVACWTVRFTTGPIFN
jgi:hypothetical protein